MNKHIPIILFLFYTGLAVCQPVKNIKKTSIPYFDLVLTDGSHYRATDLQAGMPVMLVYFDPDCDHCEIFINDLKNELALFRDIHIILVTYVPIQQLRNFITKTGLVTGANLKAGTEGTSFTVRYHYDVVQFPYVAMHDRNGELFATYESLVPGAKELALMFKK